jgi:hypothetical protein
MGGRGDENGRWSRPRSGGRAARTVLAAAQILVALAVLNRVEPEPPGDPDPLRWWLLGEVLTFRRLALLTRRSPPRR